MQIKGTVMINDRRKFMHSVNATALLGIAAQRVRAAPLRSVQWLVGFPAGSTPDTLARQVAEELRGSYADSVYVENRPGVGGQLAAVAAKAGRPDGSVVLLTPMPIMSVYPFTYRKLSYDPVADFTPVARAVVYDRAFTVGAAVPETVRTIPDFVDWARRNPASAVFASPAAGSPLHFTGILIGRALGLDLQQIPYKGTVAAIPDLLSGRVPAIVSPLGEVYKYKADGKLRILGTSGAQRSPFTPDVRTFAEQGLSGIGVPEGYAVFAPAKTPPDVVAELNTAVRKALMSNQVGQSLTLACMEPAPSTPGELATELASSMRYWGPVVKSIGFTADA